MKTAFKSVSSPGPTARVWLASGLATLFAAASSAGSLWPGDAAPGRGIYADRKAAARGDIVTIIVAESAVGQSSQNTKSSRDSSVQDALQQFIFAGLGTHHGELPGVALRGKAAYSGGGDIRNSQAISARAAVLVTDVLPNGNLVLEGVRVIKFAGETQYVVLRGIVRPDDIARDNSVTSTNIADARVEFHAEGTLTDAQKRGWMTKIYEKLRPF